jgi:SAM-dependent methyltransferase
VTQDSTEETGNPLRSFYSGGAYVEHNPGWHEGDAGWKANHVYDMLTAHGIAPRSVCDIGCGTGAVLEHLGKLLPTGTKLVGMEPSAQALALAPPERRAMVTLIEGDERAIDQQFDLMLMLDVFEHVDDYLGLLRRSVQVASWAIFHIPLDLSAQAALRGTPFLTARTRLGHLHSFNRETALATLSDTGYEVVDSCHTAGALDLPSPTLARKVARIPRTIVWHLSPAWAARILGGFSLLVLAKGARP